MKKKNQFKTNENERRINMAVFTAECDRAFIVASDKAEEFKNVKVDKKIAKKIEEAKEKFKNIKAE